MGGNEALIKSGGGTGPTKPRQPTRNGANAWSMRSRSGVPARGALWAFRAV